MSDTTVYVAIVTGVFAVIGATIPQASAVIQTTRLAKREQRDRQAAIRREACVTLLRSVNDLRTQVADNHDYRGSEMAQRLALVRQYASAADISAFDVTLLVPDPLAGLARELAAAAARLAALGENTSRPPDFTEIESCAAAFTAEAVKINQG